MFYIDVITYLCHKTNASLFISMTWGFNYAAPGLEFNFMYDTTKF